MSEITWTKCSERMPPDNIEIIVKAYGDYSRHAGSYLHAWLNINDIAWTLYTPEAWKELNG